MSRMASLLRATGAKRLTPKMADQRPRCACLTVRGAQCKKTALVGGIFCSVHQNKGCVKQAGKPIPAAAEMPNIDYLAQLDDSAVEAVCRQLIVNKDYRALAELVASKKRFRGVCQPLLREAEDKPTKVDDQGNMFWEDSKGRYHRSRDQPAIVWADGTRTWMWHGKLHREGDQPAAIYPSGTRHWYWHDELHREGGQPAIIRADGTQQWWVNGRRVR